MPLLTRVFPLQSGKGRLKGKRYGIAFCLSFLILIGSIPDFL